MLAVFHFVDANLSVIVQSGLRATNHAKAWLSQNTTAEMWAGLLLLLGLLALLSGVRDRSQRERVQIKRSERRSLELRW